MTPEQFLLIADLLPEPILLLSADGLILAGNKAVEERLGIAPWELRGKKLSNVVADPPEEATRQQDEALRASEARFRQLADAMPQIVWTAGPDGIVDYSNRRWHQFTGLTQGFGNEGWSEIIHPEDMPAATKKWEESFRSGTLFEMEIRLLDRHRGGYRWHLIRTVPVRDDAGVALRWYGTATDISDQKQTEDAALFLAEASAALSSLVDYESTLQKVANLAVPHFADWSAVDVVGDDGKLRRLAVAHRDAKKIQLAKELLERYPPDPNAPGGTHHIIRTRQPVTVPEVTDEMLVKAAKDQEHLRMIRSLGLRSYICVPLVVSEATLGALTFATAESGRTYSDADLALAQDLSRRAGIAIENANLYRTLKEENRRKNEFLALLAHELRNPLAPLRNGLQIIRLACGNGQAVEQARGMMERQLQHLVRLVDDLLDVSRISRGKIELHKERIEAAEVVKSALETCDPILQQYAHEVSLTIPDEPIYVDADKTRLAQAICNLLSNAAKFTAKGGRIWLTVERQGSEVQISVKDSGVGIPAPMLAKVFDLFTQVDRSLEKSQGGLGIGLTIVKQLIELHGGTVEAKSAGHGMGSEFLVRLPVALPLAHEESERDDAGPQTDSAPRHRILVVDDSVDAASSLALMLQMMGSEVRTAHDGLEGVEAAEAFRPDLILLDIGMPKLNGYDACRRIRQQPWGKSIFIAALTGWGQEEDKRLSQEAGFNLHMVKPPDLAALERLIASLKAGVG